MSQAFIEKNILERFLRYVKVDTMSDINITDKRPSTEGQMKLLKTIEKELKELGVKDLTLDKNGYLVARIKGNTKGPTVGFMAHVDVASDVMGNGVKPRVIDAYDGKDIVLNDQYTLTVKDNEELLKYVGRQLVVTDGTTLLGGDDKAGVAILVSLADLLINKSKIEHADVELIFTTDEETGRGMDAFDISMLNSRCCYTFDGGKKGEVEAECFNAATVVVDFYGVPYHLGAARGRLVNSITMATSFINALPQSESPEATDGRYGYYCAHAIEGSIEHTKVVLYLRDFDLEQLKRRIATLESLKEAIEMIYVEGKITLNSEIVYENMYEAIKKEPQIMQSIYESAKKIDLELHEEIIRGGTDGARLAQMGIAAPNLFTGSHNLHSRFEWVAVPTMVDATLLAEQIVAYWGADAK